jgi:hypothetical protein
MSSQEFLERLCKLLCKLDKLVKEYLFGTARECKSDCKVED